MSWVYAAGRSFSARRGDEQPLSAAKLDARFEHTAAQAFMPGRPPFCLAKERAMAPWARAAVVERLPVTPATSFAPATNRSTTRRTAA